MSDWRTDFERLQECYSSYAALADQLGVSRSMVQKVAKGTEEAGEDFREAVREHREQIQAEHTIARSMDATFQQAMTHLRGADTMDEVDEILDRTEEILSDERPLLCD